MSSFKQFDMIETCLFPNSYLLICKKFPSTELCIKEQIRTQFDIYEYSSVFGKVRQTRTNLTHYYKKRPVEDYLLFPRTYCHIFEYIHLIFGVFLIQNWLLTAFFPCSLSLFQIDICCATYAELLLILCFFVPRT